MDFREFTAKTVDEAITQACLELGVTSDRLQYDIIQEATSGFLGIGSKPAIIRAGILVMEETAGEQEEKAAPKMANEAASVSAPSEKKEEAPKKEEPKSHIVTNDEIEKRAAAAAARARVEGNHQEEAPARSQENHRKERYDRRNRGDRHVKNAPAENIPHHEPSKPKPERVVKERTEEEAAELKLAAETFLKNVFGAMEINAEISTEYNFEEGAVSCSFEGEEMGLLIGKRGQTLDSLQYLTSLVVNKKTDDYVRVKLDTEGYRSRRADTLNNLARNIAYKVRKTRRPVALEPMNPYERRIIHYALQSNKYVETYSEGEEPYRHVVVAPKW